MGDHARSFRNCLEKAAAGFDMGWLLVESGRGDASSFDQMMAECARAYRLARDAPDDIKAIGVDPAEFTTRMKAVKDTRDVIEHHQEVKNPRAAKGHVHLLPGGLKVGGQEGGLLVLGPTQILNGRVNLYDINVYVRQLLARIKS